MNERIGPYRLERELARGGMGVVYLATHDESQARVVIKRLLELGELDPELQTRFRREAEAQARLSHPAIVRVHGAAFDVAPYLVQAYLPGGTLADRLQGGPLPVPEAVAVVRRIGEGLAHAHACGVLHRDLKPGNVLFDERGQACLTDFGLATLRGAGRLTETGAILGTPAFMAPEQASDAKRAGVAADVYGLGALLYACLTGRGPFAGRGGVYQTLAALLEQPPEPLGTLRPETPAHVQRICERALSKDPARRPPDVTAFLAGLDAEPGAESSRVARPLALAAVGGSLVAVVLAGAWLAHEGRARPSPSVAAAPRPRFPTRASGSRPLSAQERRQFESAWDQFEAALKELEQGAVREALGSDTYQRWGRQLQRLATELARAASVLPREGEGAAGRAKAQGGIARTLALLGRTTRRADDPAISDVHQRALEVAAEGVPLAWAHAYARSRRSDEAGDRDWDRARWLEGLEAYGPTDPLYPYVRHWRLLTEVRQRTHPDARWQLGRLEDVARRDAALAAEDTFAFNEVYRTDRLELVKAVIYDRLSLGWHELRAGRTSAGRAQVQGALDLIEAERLADKVIPERIVALMLLGDLGLPLERLIDEASPAVGALARAELLLLEGSQSLTSIGAAFAALSAAEDGDSVSAARLGWLHVRVLQGGVTRDAALAETAATPGREALGVYWHLPEHFAGTLDGDWWPGRR